jgi:glycerol kinase
MLFDIHRCQWDDELLRALEIPASLLPEVRPSSAIYGDTEIAQFGAPIPICGDAGDQQAATFGQMCFAPGSVKNTYGTGNFMLMNTGTKPRPSENGLLTTIAWQIDDVVTYALEGSVFVSGAAVQWLRDELQLIASSADTEILARSVPDTGGVYVVPAFVGLGAPYWDPYARGTIVGLTRGSGRAHIVRAVLESVAYQSQDVLQAMQADTGLEIPILRVDGGMVGNEFLMQFQSDISQVRVERPEVAETTALGAAYLAGLASGFWHDQGYLVGLRVVDRVFDPEMGESERQSLYQGWLRAVERARDWER